MTFYEVLEQARELLQRHGRLSYRALKRQFQLDDACLEDLKAELVEVQRVAVDRYEGTVNQVLGDGIMALFGAPIAHEDHAVRACYAALAMQAAMQGYAEEVRRTQGLAVQMRVGLNSGEVVVRAIGNDLHMDYSAIGQTTHLAARMEQLATPGSILLTADTLRLVEGFVRVHALGPVPVKGMAPAETHYREALALAEELGMRPLQAHCHLGLGTLYARTGQREQARAELSAAVELYCVDAPT